ncbi:MAG: PRC-barrel domain-containing protein [Dehalococcoidia bacterium]|jgi:sporulation protein YlmC with PRC-barrel domain|nr:PRC-barrel domain-containing protein [Dehalococcoidia bacterium]
MNVTDVLGKKVLDKDAISLGKVEDLVVNTSTWIVSHIVVKMGLIKKASVAVDKIEKVGDEVFLNVAKDDLK